MCFTHFLFQIEAEHLKIIFKEIILTIQRLLHLTVNHIFSFFLLKHMFIY